LDLVPEKGVKVRGGERQSSDHDHDTISAEWRTTRGWVVGCAVPTQQNVLAAWDGHPSHYTRIRVDYNLCSAPSCYPSSSNTQVRSSETSHVDKKGRLASLASMNISEYLP
jgi:hypothetical protein